MEPRRLRLSEGEAARLTAGLDRNVESDRAQCVALTRARYDACGFGWRESIAVDRVPPSPGKLHDRGRLQGECRGPPGTRSTVESGAESRSCDGSRAPSAGYLIGPDRVRLPSPPPLPTFMRGPPFGGTGTLRTLGYPQRVASGRSSGLLGVRISGVDCAP